MPTCQCITNGCSGRKVDARTLKKHRQADQQRVLSQAIADTVDALHTQDNDISSYVASLALADDKIAQNEPSPLLHSADHTVPKLHSPPPLFLRSTDTCFMLQMEVELLEKDAASLLNSVLIPSTRLDPFPLEGIYERLRHLRNRHTMLHVVVARENQNRKVLGTRIFSLEKKVNDARTLWRLQASRLEETNSELFPIISYDTAHHYSDYLKGAEPVVQVMMFTMVALHIIAHLSRRGCHFFLSMTRFVIQLTLARHLSSLTQNQEEFISNLPVDPDSVEKNFRLDGKSMVYAVCPNKTCHKLYASVSAGSSLPQYPKVCTYQEFSSGPSCGAALTRSHKENGIEVQVAIKRYVAFSFHDYLADLLARPGNENLMDNPRVSEADEMQDVYDGRFLREFASHHGKEFRSTVDTGRYTFSVSLDFFNPFENKQAGKKCSIGVISVVCMSLPASIRYKIENIFLAGVIPGPKEPPLTATNHYFTPLVDEFEVLWNPGVHFARTYEFKNGRLIQCALILVVCDLLAARKAAGFAACTHEHFCSVCKCTRSDPGLNDTDYQSWIPRTNVECRKAAEDYRNAEDSLAQTRTFDKTGLRWSELLRLPYFDITRCVVVDSMHNLFLGILKEHYESILGTKQSESPYREPPVIALDFNIMTPATLPKKSDRDGVNRLRKLLEAPISTLPTEAMAISKMTKTASRAALYFVCHQTQCELPNVQSNVHQGQRNQANFCHSKNEYATSLYRWRLQQKEAREVGAETRTTLKHILKPDEMAKIQSDIRSVLTPSWMTSIPSNFGEASVGKLKADQWRVLGTVHLPLSLTRLWGFPDPGDLRGARCQQILDLTLSLISAVTVATSRTITPPQATQYLGHMQDYLNGVKRLFPAYKLHPNHHMALHIYDFLLLFGPVHSWWTFPFERTIGLLQRTPHNFVIGELEETISRSYTRARNFRAMLARIGCPEVIKNTRQILDRLVEPQLRGSLQTDIRALSNATGECSGDDGDPGMEVNKLSQDLEDAFRNVRIAVKPPFYMRSSFSILGLTYSIASKHQGNSCIIVSSEAETHVPARIQQIIQIHHGNGFKTYFAIRRHVPLSLRLDTFQRYPLLGMKQWNAELGHLEVVGQDKVLSHFACLTLKDRIERDVIAVLPLWRRVQTTS